MIRYTLSCADGHRFESWFQSAERFDALQSAGHLSCPECGSEDVRKSLMAPQVGASRKGETLPAAPDAAAVDGSKKREMLAKLRKKIEAESDYVGMRFASEARAIHEGTAPERAIYGEAKTQEALDLIRDGVPVAPLPFIPKARTN